MMLMEPVDPSARWWPWACLTDVIGLRKREKNFEFSRCIHVFDPVLKSGSDINEGNWLQLLFHFIVLMGLVASIIRMKFYMLCFMFQIEVFSYCTLTETYGIGFQKRFDHEGIDFGFFVEKWLLSLT